MRLEFDEHGYVCCILYGCSTGSCVEYTGLVPTQPEEYVDMDDWANHAKTQAYYLNDQGNLTYDAAKAETIPEENSVTPYTLEQLRAFGIIDAIYPVGSLYMSVNNVSPETLFGGTWEQIEDRFLLASGSAYQAGSTGGTAIHYHTSPVGYNQGKYLGISYAKGSRTVTVDAEFATPMSSISTGTGSYQWTLPFTDSVSNLPPYLAVFVWKRTA